MYDCKNSYNLNVLLLGTECQNKILREGVLNCEL